jgi:hypothetical protein
MKWFAISAAAFICAFFFAFKLKPASAPQNIRQLKLNSVSCSPDWNQLGDFIDEMDIPPMPGGGKYKWNISTSNDSAQFYFNQGINMYYGFHIIEAMASFKKAARFDAQNPMLYWAQALAYGPNINDVGYAASPAAYEAAQKALSLSSSASAVEKELINAMSIRYSNDSSISREKLNGDYVAAMKKAYENFPSNADIAALYADAMMLQHPWQLWNNDGSPKPWTPQIRFVLEKLISFNPQHPGANHYYIHVMEASPFASLALPSADRLGSLTPGLSHMVHMPSHIYLRLGQFNKGTTVNEEAIATFKNYASLFPAANENAFLYQWHNLHMQADCGLLAGRYQYTLNTAQQLQNIIDTSFLSMPAPMGAYVQYLYVTPALVNIHFGKWKEVLKMQQPSSQHSYASIIYHFSKGMAYTTQNKIAEAENENKELRLMMNDEALKIPIVPFSAAIEGAKCADYLLAGFIEMKKGNNFEAEAAFKKAVETEEAMVYNEPRDWLLNTKQYLGNFYLKMSRWNDAEKAFMNDMKFNNENVWSLYGLQMALEKAGKKEQAKAYNELLKKLKVDDDVPKSLALF